MNEKAFWVAVWRTAGVVVVSVVVVIAGCNTGANLTVRKLVQGGADPISAHCAIHGVNQSNAAVCTLAVQKEAK